MLEQPEDELLSFRTAMLYPPGDGVKNLNFVVDLQTTAGHEVLHTLHLVEAGRLGHEIALDVLESVVLER